MLAFPSGTAFLNQNHSSTCFWRKKIPRPATENFHHLQTFIKASFTLLSTKNFYNSHAHNSFEILHDQLPGRDLSVEKHWSGRSHSWVWSWGPIDTEKHFFFDLKKVIISFTKVLLYFMVTVFLRQFYIKFISLKKLLWRIF